MRHLLTRALVVGAVAAFTLAAGTAGAGAGTMPTGERHFGNASVEPAYDAATGNLGYLLTPVKAPDPVKANPHAWAPIYIPVYPTGTTVTTTLNCMHSPVENCPSHGNMVAAAAQQIEPAVYGGGVLGHDHVADFPGGDDFHIAWEPVLVLFTSAAAANTHLTTDAAILAARDAGQVLLVPAPDLTFNCSVVPVTVWNHATA